MLPIMAAGNKNKADKNIDDGSRKIPVKKKLAPYLNLLIPLKNLYLGLS